MLLDVYTGRHMVALVTGGGRGIGRVVALRLASNGWDVAIAARSENELKETVVLASKEAKRGRMISVTADVADPAAAGEMVRRTEKELGPIDLLINNAGVTGPLAPFWENDPGDWWRCQEINLRGPMLCCREVVPSMMAREGGRIINVSSGAGIFAIANMGAYAVSKAALIRFSEQLALELAPYKIAVFPIRPGVVRTRMVEQARRQIPIVQQFLDEGRDVPPEATADMVEFLASGRADALSGYTFSADQNWEELVRRAEDVRQKQLYLLRMGEL